MRSRSYSSARLRSGYLFQLLRIPIRIERGPSDLRIQRKPILPGEFMCDLPGRNLTSKGPRGVLPAMAEQMVTELMEER